MKIISPALHGIIDYVMSGVFLALPFAFAFTDEFAWVCYALGAGYLVVALLTNMPFGFFKWIPFRVHGGVELVSALMFIASPWLFGFAQSATARNLFIGLGVAFLLVYALTDWRAQRAPSPEVELG
ncbi:MAG TPA: SPW repeat protein [Hymenobacter sp.]|jgi:hypothetical protein|uniref:SPW repeat domain-containing protein n=1 Tax=Hymenobacter sp. TaxID=1898978 RepID=UPI002ED8080E